MKSNLSSITTILVGFVLANSIGCTSPKPTMMNTDAIDSYARAAARESDSDPLGMEERAEAIARWQALLADLSSANVKGNVAVVYAEDAFFNDTLKTLTGAAAIEAYLLETAKMLEYGTVSFEDVAISGEDVYVRWRMVYRSKVLSKKKDIVTIGMTHLRFNSEGKVVLHQDFCAATRGVFEHVPVVGAGIRLVKKRL
ncbi:MAG: nuclear transport factor 2 family protein [Verrucomicrobia bacterium]|nr:nuclear transport factor 2 family protein [Verrucomicrobiota bacterium]